MCALVNGGGYAEYVAVPAGQCLAIPLSLDVVHTPTAPFSSGGGIGGGGGGGGSNGGGGALTTTAATGQLRLIAAACIPESYFTVWHNLFQQCNIFGERLLDRGASSAQPTVLIHGGTSGIGMATRHTHTNAPTHKRTHARTYTHTHTYTHAHTHTYARTHTRARMCAYMYVRLCMYDFVRVLRVLDRWCLIRMLVRMCNRYDCIDAVLGSWRESIYHRWD